MLSAVDQAAGLGHGGERRPRRRRGDRGDSLGFVVIWPVLIMAVLVLTVHAFIISNARSQAEVAASEGLRAVWRVTAAEGGHPADDDPPGFSMARSAEDAVARTAAREDGWRWWQPGVATVYSDWCTDTEGLLPSEEVPKKEDDNSGWVRVEVRGETAGPLTALWPDRFAGVHAVALGPAVLDGPQPDAGTDPDAYNQSFVPDALPVC